VRIAKFEIINYKGIDRASIGALENLPVVLISGKNGTGKTLLIEALVALWNGRVNLPDMVGPWGDKLSIALEIVLDPEEHSAVDDWHSRERGYPAPNANSYRYAVAANRLSNSATIVETNSVVETLRNRNFRREHPFAAIDYVAAGRQFASGASSVVDLGLLNPDRKLAEVEQMQDQVLMYKTGMQMPDVGSYLLSLDYQRFLAQRQQVEAPEDYQIIANAFESATGKRILQPRFDPSTQTSAIKVQLPSGPAHGLDDLSNGEKEMLALMYFVRRLTAAGGILVLDEPERHLHPSLQVALFEVMHELANRAQVIVVTHSASLIAAASEESLVTMEPPTCPGGEQLCPVNTRFDRGQLLGELGVTPGLLAQTDILVVVEGEKDAKWLRSLFPVELGRALVSVAGSSSQVIAIHEALVAIDPGTPWICLRDRDLLTQEQVASLRSRYPHLYVWPYREFENGLLDVQLIAATISAVREVDRSVIEREVRDAMDGLKGDVVDGLTLSHLSVLHPMASAGPVRGESHLRQQSRVLAARADSYGSVRGEVEREVLAEWDQEWRRFVDGKMALGCIFRELKAFRTVAELTEALVRRAREQPDVMPKELVDFRRELQRLLAESPQTREARRANTPIGASLLDEELVARALDAIDPEPEYNQAAFEGYGC